jgi:glyoxylase-like metal-dependent hydrolase (beta-lactamase superfamily II)
VDAGLPGFSRTLETDLTSIGFGLGNIEALILTHSDADHIGLAGTLRDGGARVLIHRGDEATLRKPGAKSGDAKPVNMLPELWHPALWRLIGAALLAGGARISGLTGAETFGDSDVLDVPGRPRVIATPGHTPGHCAFQFEQHGALFVGDAMCTLSPITGSRGPQLLPRAMNQSNEQALRSLDAIEPIDTEILLFGHGEPWRDGVGPAVEQARARARG